MAFVPCVRAALMCMLTHKPTPRPPRSVCGSEALALDKLPAALTEQLSKAAAAVRSGGGGMMPAAAEQEAEDIMAPPPAEAPSPFASPPGVGRRTRSG